MWLNWIRKRFKTGKVLALDMLPNRYRQFWSSSITFGRLISLFKICVYHFKNVYQATLNWEKHIEHICAKIGAGIGIMKRAKSFVTKETLLNIYNSIILPYFDYCSPLWDKCGSVLKEKTTKTSKQSSKSYFRGIQWNSFPWYPPGSVFEKCGRKT